MLWILRHACRNCMKQLRVANYDVLNQNDVKPKCCSRWEDKHQRNIPCQSCFHQLSKIHDVNIKWFSMRIMHSIIGTNMLLKVIGVINNNKCSFCLIAKDTIQHTFWSGHRFWSYWKKYDSCCRLRLSECLILFGIDDDIKMENVFDFILLVAKQYLYKCKIEKQLLNIDIFRKKQLCKYKIEEYDAKMSCSCSSFSSRWEPYKPYFAG